MQISRFVLCREKMVSLEKIASVENLIDAAGRIDDLNKAVRLLQDAIGQDDGGVAGIYFGVRDNPEEYWRALPQESQITELQMYLSVERAYAEADGSPEPI